MWCFTQYISLSVSSPVPEGVNLSGWLRGETMTNRRLKHLVKSTSDPDPGQSNKDSQHLCPCL